MIQGTGRGQLRKITANTATQLTWDLPLVLDQTSVWIIEEAAWIWQGDSTDMGNADSLKPTTMVVPAENLLKQPVVIAGFTVDINGVESPDGDNPIREDWIFGSQGTRTITASDTQRITDGTVLCDCSNLTGADLTAGGIDLPVLAGGRGAQRLPGRAEGSLQSSGRHDSHHPAGQRGAVRGRLAFHRFDGRR